MTVWYHQSQAILQQQVLNNSTQETYKKMTVKKIIEFLKEDMEKSFKEIEGKFLKIRKT